MSDRNSYLTRADRAAEELQHALQNTQFMDVHQLLERKRKRREAKEAQEGQGALYCGMQHKLSEQVPVFLIVRSYV
jgi:hypothetical protein